MMGHKNPESSSEKVKRSSVKIWKGKPENFIWDKVVFVVFLMTVANLIGCYNRSESAPFFDGMYLKYETLDKCIEKEHQISNSSDGTFHVKVVESCDGKKRILGFDKELVIDEYGKILKSSDDRLVGKWIDIWIPQLELDGRGVPPSFGEPDAEVEIVHWMGWEVLEIKSTLFPVSIYYDRMTGFMVGTHSGAMPGVDPMTMVLADTNVDISIN